MDFSSRFRKYTHPEPEVVPPSRWQRWKKWAGRYWPIGIIACLVLSHVWVLLYLKSSVGIELRRREVALGEYRHQPRPFPQRSVQLREIRLRLFAVVSEEQAPLANRVLPQFHAKIRHEVERVFRQADPLDLEEPTLDLIRGRCKAAVNNFLGKKLIGEVLCTDVEYSWDKTERNEPPSGPQKTTEGSKYLTTAGQ